MKNLKNQLQDLERQHKQKRVTSRTDDPWRLPSTPFVGVSFDPQPLPQSYTNTTSPSLNIWASKQRRLKPPARKESTSLQKSQSIADVVTSTKTPDVLPIQKVNPVSMFLNSPTQTEKPKTYQFIAPVIKPQIDYEEFDNAESIEHLFMAKPENAESTRFLTRLQGRLRDWYHSLGEYRQLHIQQSISHEAFMKSLGNEAYRALEARNVTIAQTTLGELYQLILNALVKLCNQKKFLAEFERTGKCLGTTCDDRYLQIKCKDKSSCDCTHTKKKFHSKRFLSLSGKPRFSRQGNKKWKFIRKKKKRVAKHLTEPVDVSDLESLYSLDDEPSDSVLCTIAYSDLSSDDDSDTDSLEGDSDFRVHMINPIPHVLPIQEDPPLPLEKIHLLTDAYAKPISVISFFDTGSSVSILNPNILPDHYWKPHHQNFMAANGKKFVIDKISVPINIRLFPKCVIKIRLLGSSSHGKDLLIGFDILHKLPNLRWTDEDVNPTKASHPRMNPDHYQLAKEECEQLVSQGIIEPTTSPWACKAFYVNKRSEQVRGKRRLVIDYPPLNHFLADDKFPLPQKKSLFQHLADARVLFMFDLKYGFWQLGIKPDDRPKTAFCIPDHHYQWKSHAELLFKFYSLVTKYEIMLSEKKMEVGWKFTVKHVKGTENVLADFLSRPKAYKLEENYVKDASRVQNHTPHFLLMVFSVTSQKEEGSSSNTTQTVPVFDLPEEIVETIGDLTFEKELNYATKCFLLSSSKTMDYASKALGFTQTTQSSTTSTSMTYGDIKGLMARANGVDPDKIPYHVMWNILIWSEGNPDAYRWIEANGQWLYENFDHCEVETSDDDDDARSLWSSDDEEHFDPFEDDPTHPDARWSP
uniref:Zinc finger, CCHC-type, viral movement protein n=1 Tax=Tanacetum cinerariifolium TaxID=118510 RepID=A0A6L2JXY8_TANCI|nr:zinc finger, CCHC-type, viral movement protein [Tanacetum cinerariifolium]